MNRDGHKQSILLNTHMHSLSLASQIRPATMAVCSPPLPLCFHLRRLLPHKMSKSTISSSALPSPPPSSASSTPLNSLNLSLWFQPMAGIASSSTTHHHRWWPKVSLSRLIFNTHLKIHIPLWKFNLSYYPLVLAPQSLV